MSYVLNQNDIVEIQMIGRLHQQRIRNVFHYRYTGTTQLDGPTTLDALADEFQTEVWTGIKTAVSNEYILEKISVQRIKATRMRARFKTVLDMGGVQGNSLPSTVSIVLRRNAQLAGRRYQGRVYIAGVPVTSEDNSRLTPGAEAAWSLIAEVLTEKLEGGTQTEPFTPIVSTKTLTPGLDDVDQSSADPILRVQRRREIGVGE